MNLINQPTLRPTRKMAAVGWTSLLGPIVAAVIAPWLPGLSEACGGEVGASLVAGGLALAQGAVNFVTGDLPLVFHPATTGARWLFTPIGAG
jgi:hypothetical protein